MSEREDEAVVSLFVRDEEDVSPECLAWADSCFSSFPDNSDNNNWGTFRDALTEIIDIHPEMFVPSSTGTRSFSSPDEEMTETESSDLRPFEQEADSGTINNDNFSSSEEASEMISLLTFESDPSKISLQDRYFLESMAENGTIRKPMDSTTDLEGVERIDEDGSVSNGEAEEELDSLLSQAFKDDYMSPYIQENVDDCNVLEDPVNETPQEIFKVWDLEVADDNDGENGLVLQLKKELDVSSTMDDDQLVAEKSGIDDLIAGISDLSLAESFK